MKRDLPIGYYLVRCRGWSPQSAGILHREELSGYQPWCGAGSEQYVSDEDVAEVLARVYLPDDSDNPTPGVCWTLTLHDAAATDCTLASAVRRLFAHLTEEQRSAVVSGYCHFCWGDDPCCHCMNDE